MQKIIVITGQTATGKTSLAYTYAKRLNGELINADSRQLYKHLDIISGKDLRPAFPTYLYDIADPKEYFSSHDWSVYAKKYISSLIKKNKTPIIVGGSYLYIKHLLYGVETGGIQPDWTLRKALDKKTTEELQDMLKKSSVRLFKQLNHSDRNNPRRLIRKIEIARSQIIPEKAKIFYNENDIEFVGLRFSKKDLLNVTIKKRVEDRIIKGAFEEVKKLLDMGYTEQDPGLKTIGYQQLIMFYKNKSTKEQVIKDWITKEIQYAKRQYTFMKKNENIIWKSI